MPSINRVTLLGHLGRDPEVKYLTSGQSVTNASIATTKGFKKKDGTWENKTTWHRLVAWNKSGEILGQAVKGEAVFVEGELTQREWTGKDGQKHQVTEVLCNLVVNLGRKDKAEPEPGSDEGPGDSGDTPF